MKNKFAPPPKYKNLNRFNFGPFFSILMLSVFFFSSCVQEPEAPIIKAGPSYQVMKIKSWFEENKQNLRLPEKGINFRTESQELILPFFEKEPNWDKFHHYFFPDGREVYEISLENSEKYFPKSFMDSFPNQDVSKIMVQNILFIKNSTGDRFDPLIARYYPSDEYSKNKMKNISYNTINEYWSGRVDIFTYDEHHFVGFLVNDGKIEETVRYGQEENINGRTLGDCRSVNREVVWTSGSPGPVSEDPLGLGMTFHSMLIVEVTCTGSMGELPPSGTLYIDGEYYYEYGTGNEGCSDCNYIIPIISNPGSIILNQLTNPCASSIFKQLMKASILKSSIGNQNQANAVVQLLQNANEFDFIVQNSNIVSGANAQTIPGIFFNTQTGKNEVTIVFDNDYLENATKLSIARTFLHEAIHAYLIYIGYIDPAGSFNLGLVNYGASNGYTNANEIHHNFMSQYIQAIGYSLYTWNNYYGGASNIPRSYFDEISWGGLSAKDIQNGQFVWYDSFKALIEVESERLRVHQNITNENDDNDQAKGTPC
jgi:hypothetical protein